MTTPASALPAPPLKRSSPHAKRLSPHRLYADNQALIGVCLKRFPMLTSTDREDATGAALLGLWKAAQGFDPTRGFTFSTYAADTIRGYILRHLSEQRRQKRFSCVPLETPIGEKSTLEDVLEDTEAERPGQRALDLAGFETLLSRLPERQKDVLRGVYLHERGLTEIGAAWGMSKQRAGQLHLRALGTLRKRMARTLKTLNA